MLESVISELKDIARNGGATDVRQINPRDIEVEQWVRNKCLYGCPNFGKSFTCPPYVPGVEENRAVIHSYSEALLVEFGNLTVDYFRSGKSITEVLYDMERSAFIKGYERAFAYGAGLCSLCPECPAKDLSKPNSFSVIKCLQPQKARPSMEAAGIDVYGAVRKLGISLDTVKNTDDKFSFFGLLLIC